jgi:hypothetical protein
MRVIFSTNFSHLGMKIVQNLMNFQVKKKQRLKTAAVSYLRNGLKIHSKTGLLRPISGGNWSKVLANFR